MISRGILFIFCFFCVSVFPVTLSYSEDGWIQRLKVLSDKRLPELRFLRNEIFARHGYLFSDPELKKYFESKDWYKPNSKYSPKDLTDEEKLIVEVISRLEKRPQIKGKFIHNFVEIVDLNGDGVDEVVETRSDDNWQNTKLYVNDAVVADAPYVYPPKIVDIDTGDKFKEIALPVFLGPNNYCGTRFYSFDKNAVQEMGLIDGSNIDEKQIRIAGDGKIDALVRSNLLSPELFSPVSKLSVDRKLLKIHNDAGLFEVVLPTITVKQGFSLQRSTSDSTAVLSLNSGDQIKITHTDNAAWLLIEDIKGNKGWFRIGDIQYETDFLKLAKLFDGLYPTWSKYVDLNGDGVDEKVNFIEPDGTTVIIDINGEMVMDGGPGYGVSIVDIDTKDAYKEIAVGDEGPSDDYSTRFYYYNGKKLVPMGTVGGVLSYGIKIDGSGTMVTTKRGSILQTWFYPKKYKLGTAHELEGIEEEVYPMGTKVKMLRELPLQKSPTDPTVAVTLKQGESAVITASDDKEWCLVKSESGKDGWFSVKKIDYFGDPESGNPGYFEGLSSAD